MPKKEMAKLIDCNRDRERVSPLLSSTFATSSSSTTFNSFFFCVTRISLSKEDNGERLFSSFTARCTGVPSPRCTWRESGASRKKGEEKDNVLPLLLFVVVVVVATMRAK